MSPRETCCCHGRRECLNLGEDRAVIIGAPPADAPDDPAARAYRVTLHGHPSAWAFPELPVRVWARCEEEALQHAFSYARDALSAFCEGIFASNPQYRGAFR